MIKLLKYLKVSIIPIIIIVVLLFVQAFADLSLPNNMSDIVNVGIQQSGVEQITPIQIRQSQMDSLLLFMSEEEKETVLSNYNEKEEILYLNDGVEEETINKLNEIFSLPMTIVFFLESENDQTKEMVESLKANLPPEINTDGKSMVEIIKMLPSEMQQPIVDEINNMILEIENVDSSITEQFAISFVKSEYETLNVDLSKMQSDYILSKGLTMLFYALISGICVVIVVYLAAKVGCRFAKDLRSQVFGKVINFSSTEYNKFSVASLISRSTNDIQQIQMVIVMMLRLIVYAPILGIGALISVMNTGQSMTWVIAVAVGLILLVVALLMGIAAPKFKVLQKLVDKMNLVSREIITGIPVVRAFSREEHEEKRFDDANQELTRVNLLVNRIMIFMMPLMMLIMNAICVLIVWVGAFEISAGNMQVGNLMAFIQYTMQIIIAFLMLSMISIMLPRALVSAKRVAEVITTQNSIENPENPVELQTVKNTVQFNNVTFRYPNAEHDALKNISFIAKPGETTAIIGSTGSGKSTLVNLIMRFYDTTSGTIDIGGVNIKDIDKHDLRSKMGYVPQKGILFSGDIKSNIEYGVENISEEQLEKTAKISQSYDFINAKNEKYNYPIAQGGTNVSGGQRQRLSIARAIAKKPDIYIFDDSFSALDYKTDVALRKALSEETKDSTVLIVAQRISTVRNAQQIIVLDDGEVAGIGTHDELLKTSDVYLQIVKSQLSKEEYEQ